MLPLFRIRMKRSWETTDNFDAEDILSRYLKEIHAIPLLTEEEEKVYTARLGNDAERKEAADMLVRSNLRLVVTIANTYRGRGMPLMDIIQEGNDGLMEAARRFDPSFNVRFIT
jgi:RNA polymerase primary sigma factor